MTTRIQLRSDKIIRADRHIQRRYPMKRTLTFGLMAATCAAGLALQIPASGAPKGSVTQPGPVIDFPTPGPTVQVQGTCATGFNKYVSGAIDTPGFGCQTQRIECADVPGYSAKMGANTVKQGDGYVFQYQCNYIKLN
jgi:hypothetical protein